MPDRRHAADDPRERELVGLFRRISPRAQVAILTAAQSFADEARARVERGRGLRHGVGTWEDARADVDFQLWARAIPGVVLTSAKG